MKSAGKKEHILIAYNEPLTQYRAGDLDHLSEAGVFAEVEAVKNALLLLGYNPAVRAVKNIQDDIDHICQLNPLMIFNLCEGYQGAASQEMNVAGLWELLHIPYTGNRPLTLGVAQDKVLSKQLFEANGIPTPKYEVFADIPGDCALTFPVLAKPSREDASLGIVSTSVVDSLSKLQNMVNDLLIKYDQPILVEEFIDGREFNISVIGEGNPKVLPIAEIIFDALGSDEPRITSYEAKWLPEHPLYSKTPSRCPASIGEQLREKLETVASHVFSVMSGRDYGRIDCRVDAKENVYVLEFNPNPDISLDAGFSKALKAAGIQYEQFVHMLYTNALKRNAHDYNYENVT